jgi:hypothetical protein
LLTIQACALDRCLTEVGQPDHRIRNRDPFGVLNPAPSSREVSEAFPLAAFPSWLQNLAQVIPYTGLIEATRGITLRAQPITDFGPELAVGAGWFIVMFTLATRAYRFIR